MTYNIYINDSIGWPISAQYVRSQMSKLDPKEECAVYINSYGGSVSHGLDIRQAFIDHGNVTAYIHGMTASSATILAMGAKRIVMGRYALMLVHPCSQWQEEWGQMNAEEIQEAIDRLVKSQEDLKTIDHVIASLYADKTGKSIDTMKKAMTDAKWLTAQQALDLGLIDDILEEEQPQDITDFAKARIMACGLPLPQHLTPQTNNSLLDKMQKILGDISSYFNGQNAEKEEETKKNTMNKNFEKVNALLKVEGFDNREGKMSLTEAQMQSIEDKLAEVAAREAENQNKISDLENAKKELEAQVAALKGADGDESPEVKDEGKDTTVGFASATNSFQKLKGLL